MLKLALFVCCVVMAAGNLYGEETVDECAWSPCENGGSCTGGEGSYTCACVDGFTGPTCGTNVDECASRPCRYGGECVDEVNGYRCINCRRGHTGRNCEIDVNECASNPCENGGTCRDGEGTFSCDCEEGFEGERCSDRDVDECASNPCENGGTCRDEMDGFFCDCEEGFEGEKCSDRAYSPPETLCPFRWIYRMEGWAISGHNDKTMRVADEDECATACAEETDFLCLSVDYNFRFRRCYLSATVEADVEGDGFKEWGNFIYRERHSICDDPHQELRLAKERFSRAYQRKNPRASLTVYAEDAVLIQPSNDLVYQSGMPAIWQYLQDQGAQSLTLHTEGDVKFGMPYATERGRYIQTDIYGEVWDSGKYVCCWEKKEPDGYRVIIDIFN